MLRHRRLGQVQDGFQLFGIRPGSVYARIGFQNADRVYRLNGQDLGSPDQALSAYARVRESVRLVFDVVRRETPLSLNAEIR